MGTEIPPPPGDLPPGTDCPTCTPAVYASGHWPKFLYATFVDMVACSGFPPPPNGHPFRLEQTISPCIYEVLVTYQAYLWWIQLELVTARLRLWNQDVPGGVTFWGTADPCSLVFPTNIASCPTNNAEGGSAVIQQSYSPLASLLTGDYSFMPRIKTLYEEQQVAMDHTLIRLARKVDHTCVYFYIDDEDLPQ